MYRLETWTPGPGRSEARPGEYMIQLVECLKMVLSFASSAKSVINLNVYEVWMV